MSEDKLDSPFTELGLFKKGTGDTIQKVETERKSLPYGLLILSICGYWDKLGHLQTLSHLKTFSPNHTHLENYLA